MASDYWGDGYWGDGYWGLNYWGIGGTAPPAPFSMVGAWMGAQKLKRKRKLDWRVLLLIKQYFMLKQGLKP